MTINFRSGGSWLTAADLWVHHGGGWQRVVSAWRNVAGTWHQFHAMAASTLAVSVSPTDYFADVSTERAAGAFAQGFVASASGGAGGYTYAWNRLTAGSATFSGQATSTLNLSGSTPIRTSRNFTETWQVTATDSLGATATTNISIDVEFDNGD